MVKPERIKHDENLSILIAAFEGANPKLGIGISYTFDICKAKEKVGEINLRLGESREMYYLGHLGYHINPPFQGNNYGYKACLQLEPLLKKLKIYSLVITTDEDNWASRRICEKLGAQLERIAIVPKDIGEVFVMGSTKCRYIWQQPFRGK